MRNKKNKRYIVLAVVVAIVLFVLYLWFSSLRGDDQTSPFFRRVEPDQPVDGTVAPEVPKPRAGGLNLVYKYPPNGILESPDAREYVTLEFDDAVDLDTLDYTVSPGVKTVAFYKGGSDEKAIVISPNDDFWYENVNYRIVVKNIDNKTGTASLSDSITIDFTRVMPSQPIIEGDPPEGWY